MLGNDVVDLFDADAQPETFRPRFDARVFAGSERRRIAQVGDPHARRWAHWAAKEAAFKLLKQVDAGFVFAPSKLVAHLSEAVGRGGGHLERRGFLELPEGPLADALGPLELRSDETAEWVHVLAAPRGSDWEAVRFAIERVPVESQASGFARSLVVESVARELGIKPARVSIGQDGRIPRVEVDGARIPIALSLSHHWAWVAFATGFADRYPIASREVFADELTEERRWI